MAINHTYTTDKLKISPFLTRLGIHVIRSDDLGIKEYLIHARRSLFHSLVCASNPPYQTEKGNRVALPSEAIHKNKPSWKPREKQAC